MPKYNVEVVSNLNTVWEAESETEALQMADEWVGNEYGDLRHKCDYRVREIK